MNRITQEARSRQAVVKEPLIKCVFGSRRSFSATNSLLNLEIHTVFLRFRASL